MIENEIQKKLNKIIGFCKNNSEPYFVENLPSFMFWDGQEAEAILNLIEKLQKENEEYKKQFVPTPEHPIPVEYQTSILVNKRDYISKNIIKKKLDYVDNNIHLVNPYSREDIYEMGKLHGIGEFCEELSREE